MNEQKELAKIAKLAEKKKSGGIIKLMDKADGEVLVAALEALGKIGDEDSCNRITHCLDHSDGKVRIAACKAALSIGTEYMKTRVRHQMAVEGDSAVKQEIQNALNSTK